MSGVNNFFPRIHGEKFRYPSQSRCDNHISASSLPNQPGPSTYFKLRPWLNTSHNSFKFYLTAKPLKSRCHHRQQDTESLGVNRTAKILPYLRSICYNMVENQLDALKKAEVLLVVVTGIKVMSRAELGKMMIRGVWENFIKYLREINVGFYKDFLRSYQSKNRAVQYR
jgi:hypothetical protein